jgi:hypothetical protein
MHQSTLIVLVFLTLGQIFMLTCGVLVLWLAGELGNGGNHADEQGHRAHRSQQPSTALKEEPVEPSIQDDERLVTLLDEHSIQPADERSQGWEDGIEHSAPLARRGL